ncbi:MarR family protein [Pirellulimonas nuda]|uniref:MarR family protein n=1 Tax=Pirellulimonas nuda TaxID=2528009 RepID=A0A518DCB4_9BACT|nr:helix-turn-helix domain-containing protein [Pirellulimonas nuda]QDU89103.1 MarR family protein [Pirellulimonas nuda]
MPKKIPPQAPTKSGKQAKKPPGPGVKSPPLFSAPPRRGGQETRHRWTFLTNHSHVLILLNAEPDLVLREIAARVGITERAIQQILADLQEEGFIEREKIGRRNHYRVKTDHYLRHPIEAHCKVADLLSLIVDHPDAKKNAWL